MTETMMLEMLMPVTSATPRTVPATNPPTIAPMIPRMIVGIGPSVPPMIMFVMKPAIAPRTIHAMMPTVTSHRRRVPPLRRRRGARDALARSLCPLSSDAGRTPVVKRSVGAKWLR